MSEEDFDQLAIGYLHRDLDDSSVAMMREHLSAYPEDAQRILRLADQELLISRALKVTQGSSRRMPSRSTRMMRRRSVKRTVRVQSSFTFMRVAMGAAAVLAVVFFAVSYFQAKTDVAVATLESASGNLEVLRENGSQRAIAGLKLTALDRIHTTDGHAKIVYADGTSLQLDENTAISFGQSGPGKELTLQRGSLACNAAKQPAGAPFVLHSPQTDSTVVGTVFKLSVISGATKLEVDSGCVKVTDKTTHQSVDCNAGESVVADNRIQLAPQKVVASVPEIDTYQQEFPNEGTFEKGKLDLNDAPPGMQGSVGEVPIEGPTPLYIMQSKSANDRPLFIVHDDDVVHVTFRSEQPGNFAGFEVFLCLFPKEGWSTACNLIHRETSSTNAWQTIDIPLAKFDTTGTDISKVSGMVCRSFFIQTYNYAGIKVAKVSVTRSNNASTK